MHRRRLGAGALALALLAGCGAVTPSGGDSPAASPSSGPVASIPFPGPLTEIAFMRVDPTGDWQTWVACSDLSGARQVTPSVGRGSGWPVWSPDGSRLALDTNRDDPDLADDTEINDIITMAPDGSDVRKLTDSVGVSGDPAYSPDGTLIAFDADRGDLVASQGIYVMNATDGSGLRRVTTLPIAAQLDYAPRFSPDGTQIVFTRNLGPTTAALFVVNLDGTNLRRITTEDVVPGDATWSPDGSMIAFEGDIADGSTDAWIVRPDGTGQQNLTTAPVVGYAWEGFGDPVWSPDGTHLMALRGLRTAGGTLTAGLATMRADGTELSFITDGLGDEHQPDWSSARPC